MQLLQILFPNCREKIFLCSGGRWSPVFYIFWFCLIRDCIEKKSIKRKKIEAPSPADAVNVSSSLIIPEIDSLSSFCNNRKLMSEIERILLFNRNRIHRATS